MILPVAGPEKTVFMPLTVTSLVTMIAWVLVQGTRAFQNTGFIIVALVGLLSFILMVYWMYRLHMAYSIEMRERQLNAK